MGYRKLGRNSGARRALIREITTALFRHGKIETTEAKAKELTRSAARMITLAKRGDLHARRQALAFLTDEGVVAKLFSEIAPALAGRNGGYTRIYRTGVRRGDAAPMALIEIVGRK
ncbi:MAG: 50S ribosomal protein L17 [Negativicutes bacterium]|nr:50S ribosomal protein L17 [Negativicutes bacterium]